MPGELTSDVNFRESPDQCKNFLVISSLLAGLLALSTLIVSFKLFRKTNSEIILFRHVGSLRSFKQQDENLSMIIQIRDMPDEQLLINF